MQRLLRYVLPCAALVAVALPANASALEHDGDPPRFGTIAAPARATIGVPFGFAATASDEWSGPAVVDWDFGDGGHASGGVVTHAFAAPGPAIVTLSATDGAGNRATETRVVAVTAFSIGVPGPGGDSVAPGVTRVALTRSRFRVGAGTAIRVRTGERATVVVEIERRGLVRGTLVRTGAGPGVTTFPFSGRIGERALAPGSYTARTTAIDASGNRSAPVLARFKIVKG